jgi:outer membrane protein TolC
MKLFQNTILLFIAVLFSTGLAAQDSVKTLSVQQFMQLVRQYHPVALQADNAIEQARAGVTSARGFFDPVLEYYAAEKVFDGKQYYNYMQPQVTLPTWYGIEVYAGTEYLAGGRTSPEETMGRTSYAGVSVPLLKNLLIDRRRAALQQAKILEQQSLAEKRAVLNDLLRDALNSYWAWVQQQLIKNTIDQIVIVNEKRLELIKTSYRLGERPAIDTVEALAQLQTYLSLQQEQTWSCRIPASTCLFSLEGRQHAVPAAAGCTAGNTAAPHRASGAAGCRFAAEHRPYTTPRTAALRL